MRVSQRIEFDFAHLTNHGISLLVDINVLRTNPSMNQVAVVERAQRSSDMARKQFDTASPQPPAVASLDGVFIQVTTHALTINPDQRFVCVRPRYRLIPHGVQRNHVRVIHETHERVQLVDLDVVHPSIDARDALEDQSHLRDGLVRCAAAEGLRFEHCDVKARALDRERLREVDHKLRRAVDHTQPAQHFVLRQLVLLVPTVHVAIPVVPATLCRQRAVQLVLVQVQRPIRQAAHIAQPEPRRSVPNHHRPQSSASHCTNLCRSSRIRLAGSPRSTQATLRCCLAETRADAHHRHRLPVSRAARGHVAKRYRYRYRRTCIILVCRFFIL